jgi:hypothetical protein
MVISLINIVLLTGFILGILNIIKNVFQFMPIIRGGLNYKPTSQEIFLLGLSIAYVIAFTIKGFGI